LKKGSIECLLSSLGKGVGGGEVIPLPLPTSGIIGLGGSGLAVDCAMSGAGGFVASVRIFARPLDLPAMFTYFESESQVFNR
jgi:hypothetical protein